MTIVTVDYLLNICDILSCLVKITVFGNRRSYHARLT